MIDMKELHNKYDLDLINIVKALMELHDRLKKVEKPVVEKPQKKKKE